MSTRISGLSEIASNYDTIMCDVWGVVHNGKNSWPKALDALERFRAKGGAVIMITNAPRPSGPVRVQMSSLGVTNESYDKVVTSGDVTRHQLLKVKGPMVHIGPENDRSLYDGMDLEVVDDDEAAVTISCTGLYNDEEDDPSDYHPRFEKFLARKIPMICANPDIVVERGDRLVWCGGALARDYAKMGGEVIISGKPHDPIYAYASKSAEEVSGSPIDLKRSLAIGDGMMTDVAGAARFGIDILFVSDGIHLADYSENGEPDDAKVETFFQANKVAPVAHLPQLQW